MNPLVLRLGLVLLLLAAVTLVGWWWRRRDGRIRRVEDATVRVTADQLRAAGLDLTTADAGAILLGSPTCAPCATVERVLRELAATRPGFRWVKVDAADHRELTEAHRVLRVPTLLVVDRDRRLVARTSGVPTGDDLAGVLDAAGAVARVDAA